MLDPDSEPMYWQHPSQLLDLFGEMAERNLDLVQHLQVRSMPGSGPYHASAPLCSSSAVTVVLRDWLQLGAVSKRHAAQCNRFAVHPLV